MRDQQQLALVLILLLALSGCDTSRSSQSIQSDNGRFMDLWGTYTHCFQGEDLDAMHADAQRLIQAAHTTGSVEDPAFRESRESIRLSVDPATMAAACALRAGQTAREMGRLYLAREMFHAIVIQFPQPRYQYYTAQALLGLERLMR